MTPWARETATSVTTRDFGGSIEHRPVAHHIRNKVYLKGRRVHFAVATATRYWRTNGQVSTTATTTDVRRAHRARCSSSAHEFKTTAAGRSPAMHM